MEHKILYQPSYSLLRVQLAPGEAVQAEAGALVSMSEGVDVQTQASGGMLSALKRKVLGGESFFVNTFAAEGGGHVTLAPPLPGDVHALQLTGDTILAQSAAYLASGAGVDVDTKWGGARSFFSGEGLFLLKLTGAGPLFLSSFGAIHEVRLEAGEKHVVDTGHIVAFHGDMDYTVRRVGGLKSTLFSGEGLVSEFTGPGTLWTQTRSEDAFLAWLIPHLPRRQSSGGD